MATASTSTLNRDEFLAIGTHCSESTCSQLDFLPFRCPSCSKPYCSDHWRPPSGHDCPRYDARAHDNIIPSCPLCSQPVPHPLSITPDEAVSTHLESGQCQALNALNALNAPTPSGRQRTPPKTDNVCNERKCRTKMVVPITCEGCRKRFCAKHRWGKDHNCEAGAGSKVGNLGKSVGATSGGLGVLRRAQEAWVTATTSTTSSTSSKPTAKLNSVPSTPFAPPNPKPTTKEEPKAKHKILNNLGVPTKIDKRVMAEQQSALKGLEARAKKGLLSEDEKVKYATMRAMHAKQSGDGKDECLVSMFPKNAITRSAVLRPLTKTTKAAPQIGAGPARGCIWCF
ncbi:hypothetical protein MVLG_01267 [Microbotryum lychnidis-dioicae p1A1 Lamole]|uniref:AN1-type domain-containing protein n=2 Tax=Microbotryum lychnidis-dioicae (strain p1A1 Lamole / MvSl-1064) TaxID=683840 RepID=U5H1L2_USTV1|nr:hypothetical protein MVLG_01267 [Microbotryum lychnidis-dioicae p1A1 Lamole]|eukprot:KDE08486.1 hypothetical protein MVLG_01267 [Microbotryum lychnidis-dioicae p1A1 Lamole]